MSIRYEREMSISHKDFYRLLPIALRNIDYEIIDNEQICLLYAGGNIQIIPGIEHKRKIASLVLPVLHVVFLFSDISLEDIEQFFSGFSRVYQRGGG
ncbi:MAG: hypothetical protein ABGY08_13570 [Gammaproteobacteria bacterium]|jgi:hypothetical protein|nr:hypothetical protein [Gammaproteobacteria bacterium]